MKLPSRRSIVQATRLVLVVAATAGIAVAVSGRHADLEAPRIENVILLLVDTLRADHLEIYGYERNTSPNLTALSTSAVVFERARSQAPCTFPSMNSLLTSRHPVWFVGQKNRRMGIPEQVPSIAEILRPHGFTSHAVSASPIVRSSPSRFNPEGGFARGFATFDESCLMKSADCVNGRAFPRLLEDDGTPSFAYLHYMDPHGPYRPPPKYERRFATHSYPDALIARGYPGEISAQHIISKGPLPGTLPLDDQPDAVPYLLDLYDDEIGFWDTQLARLFERLGASGALSDTMVVLAADHGESFLEHGTMLHCQTLYDTETWTPLVMWIPGVSSRRISAPVENLDVVPTILDYLGISASGLEGTSLRRLIETGTGQRRFAHSFHVNLRSVNDERQKRILDVFTGEEKVFDFVDDPAERNDLTAREGFRSPDVAPSLQEELHRWIDSNEGEAGKTLNAERAGASVERLRALGYIQ